MEWRSALLAEGASTHSLMEGPAVCLLSRGHCIGLSMTQRPVPSTQPPNRARRPFDSSRTRVGPVLGVLSAASTGDPQWPGLLLDLAADPGDHPWHRQDLSVKDRYHHPAAGEKSPKEKGLAPPVSLLRWLVTGCTPPKNGKYGAGEVGLKRRGLVNQDPRIIADALAALDKSCPSRAWYVLEGYTAPDVYLVTQNALIVVEGKRTEAGPTTSTTWMAGRHQMIRHLDAAWEIRGERSVYGLFVVEAAIGTVAVPPVWAAAAKATRSDDAIRSSLPHRNLADQEGIRRAFIGVTTWQRVVAAFGLPASLLS